MFKNRISALKWKFPLGQSSLTSDDIPRSFGLFKIPWQIQVPQVFQECASCQITALCIWPILSMFHLSLLCTVLLRSGVPACLLNMKIRHICILTRLMKIWPYQGERTSNCNLLSFWRLSFWRQISHTEKENKSHQASILCDSLRGLTSFLSPKTQQITVWCSLSAFSYTVPETGPETVLYHCYEDSFAWRNYMGTW